LGIEPIAGQVYEQSAKVIAMTEHEWLSITDPDQLIRGLEAVQHFAYKSRALERKLRLFACASARWLWRDLPDRASRQAVVTAERFADGKAKRRHIREIWHTPTDELVNYAKDLAFQCCAPKFDTTAARVVPLMGVEMVSAEVMCRMLRDIVGSPFKITQLRMLENEVVTTANDLPLDLVLNPLIAKDLMARKLKHKVKYCPWLTPDVLKLAEEAFNSTSIQCQECYGKGGRWDDESIDQWYECNYCLGEGSIRESTLSTVTLAMLADALEETGCSDTLILNHLRGSEPCPNDCFYMDDHPPSMPKVKVTMSLPHKGSLQECDCLQGFVPVENLHFQGCWVLDLLLKKGE
jgi:hypothetical protein